MVHDYDADGPAKQQKDSQRKAPTPFDKALKYSSKQVFLV